MNDGKVKILLADDHAVLRAGLRALLNAESDMEVIGEAADGEEVLQTVKNLQPDIVLLDLSMPGMNGMECLEQIIMDYPEIKVLVLTMHDDDEYLKAVLKLGAKGYVLKKAADVELLSAIRTVAKGEMFIYPSMATALLCQIISPKAQDRTADKVKSLSEREHDVLKYLALGHTNQEIADIIHVSVKTVDTYKARVVEKLGLRKRAELVRFALENGIIGS